MDSKRSPLGDGSWGSTYCATRQRADVPPRPSSIERLPQSCGVPRGHLRASLGRSFLLPVMIKELPILPPPPAGMVAVPSYPHHPIFRGGTYVGGTAPGPGPGPVPPPFPQGRGRVSLRGRGGPASHASSSADGGGGGRGILPTDRRDETDSSRSRDPYRSRTVSARGRGRGGNRAAPRPGSYAGGGIPAGLSTLVAANLPAPKPAVGAVAAAAASSISGGSGARAARQAPEGAPAAPLRQ